MVNKLEQSCLSLSNGLANVSLKYNSVGFYQMAKIAVTPTIVVAEFMLFRKCVSSSKVMALLVVSFGVAVATVTDFQLHLFGACIALAWIVPSAVNKILWSTLQQQDNWTAIKLIFFGSSVCVWAPLDLINKGLMWRTTPITLLALVALMPWLDPPGVLSFSWSFQNTFAILVSAALGFLLQWSGALALGATSAITHVILGQFKTCVILLEGYLVFNSNPGLVSICGAITALGGMSIYTYLNLHDTRQPAVKPNSRQLPLSLKSKLSKEGGQHYNGSSGESV